MRLYPFFVLFIFLILTCDDPVSPAKEEIPEKESFIQGIISDHRFNNTPIKFMCREQIYNSDLTGDSFVDQLLCNNPP